MCDVTKYIIDNTECKVCPADHVCDGEKTTKCHEPEQYVKDNNCVACPSGYTDPRW